MSTPVWTTTAGKIAAINEREFYSLQLEATSDSTITYSVIAGTLPPGIQLTSTGLLQGVPFEVATRTLYTFVVRATSGTTITDRTFKLDIKGADAPSIATAEGQLALDDSTSVGLYWVLDGSKINFQMQATDTDTATGQQLVYEVISGSLPPGVTMTPTGLISGVVELTDDEQYGAMGGFAGNENFDGNTVELDGLFDQTVFSKSRSINYEFVIRVSDGSSYVQQTNSIFVYTADFWRVSNTTITSDMNTIGGSKLSVDLSANRRPIFKTASDLGTFRHDNAVVIKIDVEDFDPLQGDLEYSIQAGTLPSGLSIDLTSGELYGTLGRQSAVETDYTFTIRANRAASAGVNIFTDQSFTMKLIGDIDIGITFLTPSNIGTLTTGIPTLLSLNAVASDSNRVLSYEITSGSLPTGVTLSPQGNFIGSADISEFTSLDSNAVTFDSNTMSLDRSYTFTVTVSDQYQTLATSKEFTLIVSLPYSIEYGNMTGHSTSKIDQNIFYSVALDPNINNPDYIFRPEDSNFGMKQKPEMLLISGLQQQTLTAFQQQMEQNHAPKTLYFGDLKTAVAKENGVIKYEVVYLEMKDPLVNNSGTAISSSITLRKDIAKPMLGPRASTTRTTTDRNIYEITTDGGLSFSTSGSKVRYANQLSADLDYMATLYPNAVANMRSRMKSLGHKEWVHLPLWMRTSQDTSGVPLGYIMAVPICYCKPGLSAIVKQRITNKALKFKNIHFIIDRYQVSNSLVSPSTFNGDGSATEFELNEIVHEEDIKLRKDSVEVFVGDNITADNNIVPTYLRADTQLRSADFENEFTLTHNLTTGKSTIVFTNAPSSGTKIRVERQKDKYLIFRNKGLN